MDNTDIILEEMDKYGADGVDFVSIVQLDTVGPQVYCSYTREEWIASDRSYPKTCRRYWKWVKNQKAIVSPQGIVARPTYAFTTDGDCYNQETAKKIFAEIKVRPLGNTDLYVIDRAEFDALKEKYGKGE
jgi:hypothetical protein